MRKLSCCASLPCLRPATVFSARSWVPPCRVWSSLVCVARNTPQLQHLPRRPAPQTAVCTLRRALLCSASRDRPPWSSSRVQRTGLNRPQILCVVACELLPRLLGALPAETLQGLARVLSQSLGASWSVDTSRRVPAVRSCTDGLVNGDSGSIPSVFWQTPGAASVVTRLTTLPMRHDVVNLGLSRCEAPWWEEEESFFGMK